MDEQKREDILNLLRDIDKFNTNNISGVEYKVEIVFESDETGRLIEKQVRVFPEGEGDAV